MNIKAKCPKCYRTMTVGQEKADKRVRCANCRTLFKIPDMQTLSKALDIIKESAQTVYVDADGRVYA